MKYTLTICCFLVNAALYAQQSDAGLKLWYNKPADAWEEALPLGNGKTGAMVFGGVATERLQLNDNTLWSGYPEAGNNPNGPTVLPQVRQAVFDGDYEKAAALWKKCRALIRPAIYHWPICGGVCSRRIPWRRPTTGTWI